MRRVWIGATAALALTVVMGGHAGAQGNQPTPSPQMQNDRDPPPGTENLSKRAERAQSAAPKSKDQDTRPLLKGMKPDR
jgi:hypothetical protein